MVYSRPKKNYKDGGKKGRGPPPLPPQPGRSRVPRLMDRQQRRDTSASRSSSVGPRDRSVESKRGSVGSRSSSVGPRDRPVESKRSSVGSRSSSVPRSSSIIPSVPWLHGNKSIRGTSAPRSVSWSESSISESRSLMESQTGRSIPVDDDKANRFVQYREFGTDPLKMMRVITISEIPALKNPSDVVVKVKASLVSLKDCYIRRGIWPGGIITPNIPGFELVGSVVLMGSEVQKEGLINIGDAVGVCCLTGGNARYAVVPSRDLVKIPGKVDSAQAASVVSNYMTAYQALHRVKPRARKETLEGLNILVTGGNGPIGQAVIELGFRAGVGRIFVTAEEEFHGKLHEQGVCPLPLDANKWLPYVKGKMDIVIDGICQDGYTSPRAALNTTGHLIIIGMTLLMNSSERGWFGTPMDATMQAFATKFMTKTTSYDPYQSSQDRPDEWKHDLDYLMRLLERGKISPTITKRVSLEAVPQLHKDLESGKINGIFVCKPWK